MWCTELESFDMHNYRDLRVWGKAMDLVLMTYELTKHFPDSERYGLVSQLNRSAVSIASNIAEGAGRNGPKEFYQFLGIANGSLAELETQLEIAKRLKFKSDHDYEKLFTLSAYVGRMITKLQYSIKNSKYKSVSEPAANYGEN